MFFKAKKHFNSGEILKPCTFGFLKTKTPNIDLSKHFFAVVCADTNNNKEEEQEKIKKLLPNCTVQFFLKQGKFPKFALFVYKNPYFLA